MLFSSTSITKLITLKTLVPWRKTTTRYEFEIQNSTNSTSTSSNKATEKRRPVNLNSMMELIKTKHKTLSNLNEKILEIIEEEDLDEEIEEEEEEDLDKEIEEVDI